MQSSFSGQPTSGFAAWQIALKYVSEHHSPDVTLRLRIYPTDSTLKWDATVSWGEYQESICDCGSVGEALKHLWQHVNNTHPVWQDGGGRIQQFITDGEQNWFDIATQNTLQRLLWTVQSALKEWTLIIVYQPIESPIMRVAVRLVLGENAAGGRGSNLLDALRLVFRNAAPLLVVQSDLFYE